MKRQTKKYYYFNYNWKYQTATYVMIKEHHIYVQSAVWMPEMTSLVSK